MNLQLHLLIRIAAVALLCLLATAGYSLHHSNQQARQSAQQIADSLGKQLELQLQLIQAGMGRTHVFPDFDVWKQTGGQPGICVNYTAADGVSVRSLCNGAKPVSAIWPAGFEALYRRLFQAGFAAVRPIRFNGQSYGRLSVAPNAKMEVAAAWEIACSLMQLSGATVVAVCLLVYLSIHRALRPAQSIVAVINELEAGQLDKRLPAFELNEWRRISSAINQLAASQQTLLADRQSLIVKLLQLQEEERRLLARELHDEFGQCLAAINAFTTSIKQTAAQQCPDVMEDAEQIGRITGRMLQDMRKLLGRLRPAEFDELGLAASLKSLVAGWNSRNAGQVRYRLRIDGDCAVLSDAQAVTLFRVAQEALTNIAKHAKATLVGVTLDIRPDCAVLTVGDDGIARVLPFAAGSGIGLLGMRERVTALGGQLTLAIVKPHGLTIEVCFPLDHGA